MQNLTNHLYTWSHVRYHVQSDNGTEIIILKSYTDRQGASHIIMAREEFMAKVDAGSIVFEKVGKYGFERMSFEQRKKKINIKG